MLSVRFVINISNMRYNFIFFNDTATTEIYTLSLHDALPISRAVGAADHRARADDQRLRSAAAPLPRRRARHEARRPRRDRKSTRLNSSHLVISYAVFCLKQKKYPEELLIHTDLS